MARISQVKMEDDWQTESDLRMLMEAKKIQKDTKRFEKAKALAKQKLLEVASIASESSDDKS